jgi:signal transduction histidine kinase
MLRVLHDITVSANEAKSFDAAISAAIERICHFNGWIIGHAWRVSPGSIVSAKVWYQRSDSEAQDFQFDNLREATEETTLPIRDDFIGEVVRTCKPRWLTHLDQMAGRIREFPRRYGVHSAIAFPILLKDKTVAVLEFFSLKEIERDERFMEIMPQVGIQLGLVFEREQLEREVAIAADREQQRMGQELHDGLSQQIAGTAILAHSLADNLSAEHSPNAEKAEKLAQAIEDAKVQARSLSRGLTPIDIDSSDLLRALQDLADRIHRTYDIECAFECPQPVAVADNFRATHLYRIAREAVHNALKHARGKRIAIEMQEQSGVTLIVHDDGPGFDAAHFTEGEGMRIMRYRAGLIGANLSISSSVTGGTVVTCKMPQ